MRERVFRMQEAIEKYRTDRPGYEHCGFHEATTDEEDVDPIKAVVQRLRGTEGE